jgi:CHAT domain-containing protein
MTGIPLQSYLVLSSDDGNYELLKAGEIFNKQMKSMCTVLTACETALGSIKSGEGMVSLARAFAYAGCPNLVVTLWSVDDQQTAGIMKQFYKKVAGGKSLHESLYESKLAYLDQAKGELRHPFYWAGITYFGTDASLRSGWWDRMGMLTVLLTVMLLLSAVVLYVKKRKNSRS